MAAVKRSHDDAMSHLDGITSIIFDIEGTTTPISFVKEDLFGYVKENIESYLTEKYDDEDTKKDITALRELASQDIESGMEGAIAINPSDAEKSDIIKSSISSVNWLMSKDRKATALKQLQGHMWRDAYKTGKVKGQLFEEVADIFGELNESKYKLYIYSTGSVEAQKLLFANTEFGDLTPIINGYFDTKIGDKRCIESYKKLADEIQAGVEQCLYLTDNTEEAESAIEAGMRSIIVVRPGNDDLSEEDMQKFVAIESFDELLGEELFTKRGNFDEEDDDEEGDDDPEEISDEEDGEEDGEDGEDEVNGE